jgi:AcrR family transcriptional regulator
MTSSSAAMRRRLRHADDRAVLPTREDIRVLGNRRDVGVPGDRPVPGAALHTRACLRRLLDPAHRRRSAQRRELLVRDTGLVDVGVGEVEASRSGHRAAFLDHTNFCNWMNKNTKLYDRQGGRMRRHGWGGDPPRDEAEARARILQITRARLAEVGSTSTSEVADLLGVTRQTVYRYYPTTDDLLNAAAMDAVAELQHDLVKHVTGHLATSGGDAGDAVAEVVAYVYEHLREDPALKRLLAPGHMSTTIAGMTAPDAIALGGSLLAGFPIDWAALGLDAVAQRELVEHLLRTLQSFVLDPGHPQRSPEQLRAYLNRWVAPAVRANAQVS